MPHLPDWITHEPARVALVVKALFVVLLAFFPTLHLTAEQQLAILALIPALWGVTEVQRDKTVPLAKIKDGTLSGSQVESLAAAQPGKGAV